MNRNIVTLEARYTPNVLATRCSTKDLTKCCPIEVFKCPFDEKCCEEIEPEDWEEIFKKEEVPFKKGELVAVKDKHSHNWVIKVFNGYSTNTNDFKYRVYDSVDDLDDAKCLNYQECEKLSMFSKKFFFE